MPLGRTRKAWYAVPYPSSFHWYEGIRTFPWAVRDGDSRRLTAVVIGTTAIMCYKTYLVIYTDVMYACIYIIGMPCML